MICDLAETYHILNYQELSPRLVATLVFGLRDDSRVKKHLTKNQITIEQTMYAQILDAVNFIAWTFTKDARKGKPYKGKSVLKALKGEYRNEINENLVKFNDSDELMTYLYGDKNGR